ncbi:GNAT family N-acetyltransferase [Mesorhizobium sp. LHD-90]|uniref:GNAT family N-acetyltransferase n=1 Tax=Mesorhizobium sp. LHD-90 TaxID=3071414 RepID=UPI0027E043F3|nr:GNAT family N-acetyltransferase [Mesorhizobium sp. LHD-90]MDQ6434815.1 GNAT family N-acetyltransferase [Mesorhizobium sp. LHD-90]
MVPIDVEDVLVGRADIEDALRLSDEAGWNQTPDDWAVFVDHGEAYGVRAGSRLVATAAILPYGGGFGWVSMVLVTADWRRRGLASRLLNRCISALRARGCAALLDATPEGALIYGQLGFRGKCEMTRWRGRGLGEVSGQSVTEEFAVSDGLQKAIAAADRVDILARDMPAFGGDRGFLLENFLDRPGTAAIGDGRNFVVLREGRRATQIGPLVAGSGAEARDLLEAALAAVSGPVILDVLDAGTGLNAVLDKSGFEAFRGFERMVLDRPDLPGEPAALMVAAGPEFG